MNNSIDDIRKELDSFKDKISNNSYNSLLKQFKKFIEIMAINGVVELGDDFKLKDDLLEIRVGLLFKYAGMEVIDVRYKKKQDFIIEPLKESGFYIPLVIEVKSSGKAWPKLDDLRQLDDWVFDLSGEKGIRKHGYKLWNKPRSKISGRAIGAVQPPLIHPERYKGVFVFNGPTNQPFKERSRDWVVAEQKQFVKDRGFCMISLESLIRWAEACHGDDGHLKLFWQKIYETNGILEPYSVEVEK